MGLKDFSLAGKRALITGGGTGIGYGIARAFADAGAHIVICGRTQSVLEEATHRLGDDCAYFVQDISDLEAIPSFVHTVESEAGPVDILVNNAGRHLKKHVSETDDEAFFDVIRTNLLSVFTLSRECAQRMAARGPGGSIIHISSMSALMAIDRLVAYSTAKTGLHGLMRAFVADYSARGIRINTIAPGWIASQMLDQALGEDAERKKKVLDRIPFGRLGDPDDIGNAALFLASDAARYVTGIVLPVDGGAAVGF